MPFKIQNVAGAVITTLDEWFRLAPPKKKKDHWKDFRSAKELARAWLRVNSGEAPCELRTLLDSRRETRAWAIQTAVPEFLVKLDNFNGPRNSDLVAEGQQVTKKILVSVEAKADECFDLPIGQKLQLARALPRSNLPARIDHLSRAVFGVPVNDQIADLRYQLLHGLAAAVIEARKRQAHYAVFVVHEFISLALDFERVEANSRDLDAFIHTVPGWQGQDIRTGRLLPPIQLAGDNTVAGGKCEAGLPRVLFGKIRTLIPLDAPARGRPRPGIQPNGQYLLSSDGPGKSADKVT